MLSLNNKIMK